MKTGIDTFKIAVLILRLELWVSKPQSQYWDGYQDSKVRRDPCEWDSCESHCPSLSQFPVHTSLYTVYSTWFPLQFILYQIHRTLYTFNGPLSKTRLAPCHRLTLTTDIFSSNTVVSRYKQTTTLQQQKNPWNFVDRMI